MSTENARFIRGTLKEQIDLTSTAKIGLETVPLWRSAFQSDALSALHRIADFHASIAKYFGVDDSFTHLKFRVTLANLNLQMAVKAAHAIVPIRWNLKDHFSIESYIVRVFDLYMAINFVHGLSLPAP